MTVYISMLRGINVSGQKAIKMADLKSLYEALGFADVTTYIQSGNVVFTSTKTGKGLAAIIAEAIETRFAYAVPVLVREKNILRKIIRDNPFIGRSDVDPDKLHVCFLSGRPDKDREQAIQNIERGKDEFKLSGENVYLYCPGGYGKTKLSNNIFEKKLSLSATTRNWKTVQKLSEMAEGIRV